MWQAYSGITKPLHKQQLHQQNCAHAKKVFFRGLVQAVMAKSAFASMSFSASRGFLSITC